MDLTEYKIGDIYDSASGISKSAGEFGFGYPFLPFKTVFANSYLPEHLPELANTTEYEREKCSIKYGDIFLTRTSETLGELGMSSVALKDYDNATFNGFTKRLRKKKDCDIAIEPKYLIYYFRSKEFRKKITSMASLTTRASLNNDMIARLPLLLPDIEIQRKIGNYLYDIDEKIKINQSINILLEKKMWAIYTHTFHNSHTDKKTLGEVTERITERIGSREATVLSAVYTGCLEPSDEHFNKRVYSKDISKYIVVEEGNFAYNPARVNIGSIGINDLGVCGCVSPVYVAFKTEINYRAFFKFYFKTEVFKEECKKRAFGSVRQSLRYDDFANITIDYPDSEKAEEFERRWIRINEIIKSNDCQSEQLTHLKEILFDNFFSGTIDPNAL